ncbi:Gfo/Idh/MocA family oxidoreductase [Acuticoccus sp. MNP-M23]|uniref:Gfo/Idh/MocA family protein n=1 Tax=Acuticoccus sp. MNP-M23 TaxID=3072793 RepID=UPI0028162E76|nr:Gfo/Idh/MocA family oxidoreductase [Acuticoccus sp. MNP-M23]WMS43663.1 Gfo/Idh/MocA family oxidoreductase [Acuticoccus sp. MNP-M23]
MTPALKVATIGAGYFSQFHHAAWMAEPRVHLAAVCDLDPARAATLARTYRAPRSYTDPAEMLAAERPDLVDIITPPDSHRALVALAASHGIDAVCQKAFTRSLTEARETAALAEAAGITLVVHENFRFSPWYRAAHGLIGSGALGEVYQAAFRLRPGDGQGPQAYLDRQPYFQTMERFLVHETAIHFIDTFRYLLGEPDTVYADLRTLNPAVSGEDAGHILFGFGNARALFDGNRLADHAAENRRLTMGELTIEGSAATLRVYGDGTLTVRRFGENVEEAKPLRFDAALFAGGAVAALQAHVVDHFVNGAPLENTARDYLRNLELEDAIYRSAATGARLAVG